MKSRNAALASAAAALFVASVGGPSETALAADHEKNEQIKCEGVNSCKGASSCKTLLNDCAGHNECKGKGFVMLTPAECEQAKADMKTKSDSKEG